MIVNYWPKWFRALYGGTWPKTYCCVDTETTGYSPADDVITEWGHCLVEDGEIVDQLGLVVDWTGRTTPPDYWIANKLERLRKGFELQGKTSHMSYERMKDEGMPPDEAFAFIKEFTDRLKARNVPFVLHNHNFDEKILSANFLQFTKCKGFTFGDMLIDTECVEKATQLAENERCHPKKNDSLRDYFHRVRYTRVAGVKSNLDDHCFTKYKFAERGVDPESMHGAKTDAFCCHLLMESFSKLITEVQPPPIYPTADTKESRKANPRLVLPAAKTTVRKRVRGQRNS